MSLLRYERAKRCGVVVEKRRGEWEELDVWTLFLNPPSGVDSLPYLVFGTAFRRVPSPNPVFVLFIHWLFTHFRCLPVPQFSFLCYTTLPPRRTPNKVSGQSPSFYIFRFHSIWSSSPPSSVLHNDRSFFNPPNDRDHQGFKKTIERTTTFKHFIFSLVSSRSRSSHLASSLPSPSLQCSPSSLGSSPRSDLFYF